MKTLRDWHHYSYVLSRLSESYRTAMSIADVVHVVANTPNSVGLVICNSQQQCEIMRSMIVEEAMAVLGLPKCATPARIQFKNNSQIILTSDVADLHRHRKLDGIRVEVLDDLTGSIG